MTSAWTMDAALGQSDATAMLRREMSLGRMSHSYLLEGGRGTGRLTLARGLVGDLLCESRAGGAACGVCRHCRLLAAGKHPDCLELPREPAELRIGRFVGRSGGTEEIAHEPVLSFLRMRPCESSRRAVIIPDSERMRRESANAFLKTLEEPPDSAVIVLTTAAKDRLPATIVSRCRRVGVLPLPPAVLAAELSRRTGMAREEAADVAEAAEGSLGIALELASPGFVDVWRWLDGEGLAKPAAGTARELARAWLDYGGDSGDNAGKRRNAVAVLDLTALAVRRRLRRGLSPAAAAGALSSLWTAAEQIHHNVRPDLALSSAAFELMAALRDG